MLQAPLPPRLPKPSATLPDPFVFVPVTQNEAAKGRGAAKRIVRAHVTRIQHAKSSLLNGHDLQTWTVKPYLHRNPAPVRRKNRIPNDQTHSRKRRTNASAQADDVDEIDVSRALVPIPKLTAGGSRDDPFWTYPVDRDSNIGEIIAWYIERVAVVIPDLDDPYTEKGVLRRLWFPLAMTEPATMYCVLLMSACHFIGYNPSRAKVVDLLAIKARALTEINIALADPRRAITDAMIGAVAKMAAYEAVFGDPLVFAAHMNGLQMMLRMRGGLSTLGLDGLLERMLVWVDLNASTIVGTSKVLGTEVLPSSVSFAGPDLYHFAGQS